MILLCYLNFGNINAPTYQRVVTPYELTYFPQFLYLFYEIGYFLCYLVYC